MSDSMMPILRQMHDAADDRARADILLRVPDTILLKFSPVFEGCCRKASFEAGTALIVLRIVALRAVRDAGGNLPADMVAHLDSYRAALAVFAAGEVAS
jgi:hypothetical protein